MWCEANASRIALSSPFHLSLDHCNIQISILLVLSMNNTSVEFCVMASLCCRHCNSTVSCWSCTIRWSSQKNLSLTLSYPLAPKRVLVNVRNNNGILFKDWQSFRKSLEVVKIKLHLQKSHTITWIPATIHLSNFTNITISSPYKNRKA